MAHTLSYLTAFDVTGNREYLDLAKTCFDWFFGHNSVGDALYDPVTGGCFDALAPDGPNFQPGVGIDHSLPAGAVGDAAVYRKAVIRSESMVKKLFARKPLKLLLAEMEGENRLRRVLGPVQLTALGVGCIIGTGIFVLIGKAANETAGPVLMLSFVVAGLCCVFSALCYAEFASMAPVAGSAFTYAYATLGSSLPGSLDGTWF